MPAHHLLEDVEGSRDPLPPILGHVQEGEHGHRRQSWPRPPRSHPNRFLALCILRGVPSPTPLLRDCSSSSSGTVYCDAGRLVDDVCIPTVEEVGRREDRLKRCGQPGVHALCRPARKREVPDTIKKKSGIDVTSGVTTTSVGAVKTVYGQRPRNARCTQPLHA